MYEISKDDYIEKYGQKVFDDYGVDAEDVWTTYHARVEYAIDLIPRFRIGDKNVTEKYLQIAFGVGRNEWKAMKDTFERLQEALASDREYMKLKSEIELMKGIRNSHGTNKGMIELMLKLYNDDFKKSEEQKIELPKTLDIKITSAKKTDEELKEFSPEIKEE